jgi:queuosine precursor transporter
MRARITIAALVALYLGAIVAANLVSSRYGASASIYNAFFLIGLDLTTRDRLHDFWGDRRWVKMAALILTGSAVSYVASVALASSALPPTVVARIALASAIAFLVAESGDAVLYHRLRRRPWIERSNSSNLLSATLDSVTFVSIAFGFKWAIIFAQITAKIAGGFCWSLVLAKVRSRRGAVA